MATTKVLHLNGQFVKVGNLICQPIRLLIEQVYHMEVPFIDSDLYKVIILPERRRLKQK